ncbi:MAG TPA: hypothetical protein VJ603_00560 [Paucimonas sp.]|nr:hypothetical protein [Paucimonas sp.]
MKKCIPLPDFHHGKHPSAGPIASSRLVTAASCRNIASRWSVAMLTVALCGPALAQTAPDSSIRQRATDKFGAILQTGKTDLYLSGYAYHARETYSARSIDRMNEQAWGAGFGKSLRDADQHEEALYLVGIKDSHNRPMWMAGYAWQWLRPLGQSGLEAGAGLSASLIHREDYFGGFPFPALFPVASVGSANAKLMLAYIPRISLRSKPQGNVLLALLRFEFE